MSDPRKLAEEVQRTRTSWLEQHGVPISQEFADFAEAIGNLCAAHLQSAPAPTEGPSAERNKHKEVCDMLREMALEKPDIKLSIAASILLGVLHPITEADKKRGREIQEILDRAAAMRDDK